LKQAILNDLEEVDITGLDAEGIDNLWAEVENSDELSDYISDLKQDWREGSAETPEFGSEYSRHYESKGVAAQMLDGSWVGWTYWYGGGKHSDPGSIDWMGKCYALEMTVVMKPVKEWRRV